MKIQITNKATNTSRTGTPEEYADLLHGFDGTELQLILELKDGAIFQSETEWIYAHGDVASVTA